MTMTTDLWTPSDELLGHDPIALQKIQSPFAPLDLEPHGVSLADIVADDANEVAACLVLASLDDDDAVSAESGETDDDDEIDEFDDGPVEDDV
ncbi:MAG: hypothetical protein QOI64_2747 [Solirubrobacteraceae bacterium]|jgi:hypothetical protein|nr:hypothetical protein [Solirubrobacteraceae bacterium]